MYVSPKVTIDQFIALKNLSSKSSKLTKIKNNKDNKDFLKLLRLIVDDKQVTGIGKAKLKTVMDTEPLPTVILSDIDTAIDYLLENNTGKLEVIGNMYYFAQETFENDKEYMSVFMDIISKRYRIGIGAKAVNEALPEFIDIFDVMLAKSWDKEKYQKQLKEHGATITVKLDGVRGVLVKRKERINLYTREGNELLGFNELFNAYTNLPTGVYDGELLCLPLENEATEDLFRRTNSVISSDDEVTDVQHIVFEYLTLEEWDSQTCDLKYSKRKERLTDLLSTHKVYNDLITLVQTVCVTDSVEVIDNAVDTYTDLGYEGVMINLHNKKYKWGRSDSLLKFKLFDSADLLVLDVLEGDMQNKGKAGALLLQWRDNHTVEVGSGITKEERVEYFNNKDSIIGKIVTIDYQKESRNKNGGLSVRFPTFRGIRHDKTIKDIRYSDKD